MIQIVILRSGHKFPVGFPAGYGANNIADLFTQLPALLAELAKRAPTNLENAYFTVAHHVIPDGAVAPTRTKESFNYQTVLQFDLDHTDNSKANDYLPLVAKVLGVMPQHLIFINSGNGLHFYVHLKTPIRSAKYIEETKPHYNEILYKISRELKAAGLPGKPDPAVYSADRIMRLPGTKNIKIDKATGKPVIKDCVLVQNPGLLPLELDVVKISGLELLQSENISRDQLKRSYPHPDFVKVAQECVFLKSHIDQPAITHEPQFFSLVGLLGAMNPSDLITVGAQTLNSRQVAEHIYTGAVESASLQKGDFEYKFEHGLRHGAPKCRTVEAVSPESCKACPHYGKLTSPLQLKSEAHVSSGGNGYWVMGDKGPRHPHYSDCAKLYKTENPYVTCEPSRIFTFDKSFYLPTGELTVKSWLEKKIGYEDMIREAHRVEFLKKILVTNALTIQGEKDLFEESIRGKLNCRNGVVDMVKGTLLPHDPRYGFKYVLPYDYVPDQVSEPFLNWLSEVMQDRVELMESLLDMMAYCLWPTYDDHVFMMLVGEGSNGKSTLIHIMEHLLGKENTSSMSIAQLSGNRFAPAGLEGKLANISEESSGTDLTTEEVNVIKALSAAGSIRVENKGEKGFDLTNFAKLIFSVNKIPRFHESGKAIRRRLLAVPFDATFAIEDPKIEKMLLKETPKICSMLVTRIQDNTRMHHGVFKVSRGGADAQNTQERVLLAGNSAVEWGKECLDSSLDIPEEKYIVVNDAYHKYKVWCEENTYKPMNSKSFGHTLTHGVLCSTIKESKVIRVGKDTKRVFPRTQWKEES